MTDGVKSRHFTKLMPSKRLTNHMGLAARVGIHLTNDD